MSDILSRLRKKRRILIDNDELRHELRLINPDGPEAASTLEALQAQVDALRSELEHFVDIVDGTETTGFDPHVEQMLMNAAETARPLVSLQRDTD